MSRSIISGLIALAMLVPNEWMHQGGGYPVILTYDHNWHLEPNLKARLDGTGLWSE
jgi:hypothetical protein